MRWFKDTIKKHIIAHKKQYYLLKELKQYMQQDAFNKFNEKMDLFLIPGLCDTTVINGGLRYFIAVPSTTFIQNLSIILLLLRNQILQWWGPDLL